MSDTPREAIEVRESVLTISPLTSNFNMQLATMDPNTRAGQTFGQGYFEARIKFPSGHAGVQGGGMSWPAFWSVSQSLFDNTVGGEGYAELDFFESGNPSDVFGGTVHVWRTPTVESHFRNPNVSTATGSDFSQWQVVGCLWSAEKFSWYLNGVELRSVRRTVDGVLPEMVEDSTSNKRSDVSFGIFDLEAERRGMNVILGTGVGRPFSIDWVQLWTA